jgi:hypothetical protein
MMYRKFRTPEALIELVASTDSGYELNIDLCEVDSSKEVLKFVLLHELTIVASSTRVAGVLVSL